MRENIATNQHRNVLNVLRNGRLLGVCASVDNCRLFVGGIPKTKKREEILTEMRKVTDGVIEVIVYPSAADKTKNRGFAFVEYESHRAAAMARRKLLPGREPKAAMLDLIATLLMSFYLPPIKQGHFYISKLNQSIASGFLRQ